MYPTTGVVASKIVSPTVEQDLKARGVAQIIVVLKRPMGAAAAVGSPAAASRVAKCFIHSERSQTGALLAMQGATRGAAARAAAPELAGQMYPNLGVMLGTVDAAGLRAVQAEAEVDSISGTPQISLIRPNFAVAAATPKTKVTWGIDQLNVPALWGQGLTGKNIKVGHLDTGADGKHPALKKAIAGFAEFEASIGRRVKPDPAPYDSDEHGTHTAATIAGRPVSGKHIGVAHGVELYSGMVIEGGQVVARVLGGLDWAIGNGVRIVSMSLGFRGWWEDFIPIFAILRERGILPVIAVGNEGPGTSRSPGNYPNALSVGAADSTPRVPDFSSSQTFVRAVDALVPDLVAPGVNVISARPKNRYQSMDGSSMATPHIAGLAALLMEAAPGASPEQIEQAIFGSCRTVGGLIPDRANRGLPDAVAAFTALTGTTLSKPKKTPAKPAPSKRPKQGAKKTSRKNRLSR